ncbi:unnamed protein product [Rhizoctonia solani]|uniref:Uncharacterized protein n=1 Tax=Rhizoctonia solani TaxID=456999 RepID=A0A8H3B4F8_9AGAM|nr:unnamed protein product [Rhizoctonia solani]
MASRHAHMYVPQAAVTRVKVTSLTLADSQHIRAHKARNNLFIAHPDDRWTPISGVDLEHQSIPWPGDMDSVKRTASAMRTSFKQKLSEVPIELKKNAYLDFIACHGPHGHRNCSWDPSSLAYYANLYLLDVLQYTDPTHDRIEGILAILEPSLPEVSPEFVKHHGLEPAVRDGVIQIKEIDTGLNHMSSLPNDNHPATGTVVLCVILSLLIARTFTVLSM